jgi:maltodextrin utilization protein YvdJ
MQDVVNQITANPLFSLVLALVAFILIFLILKSLFRIALFLVAVFMLYVGYVYFLQEKYPIPEIDPKTVDEWTQKVVDLVPTDFNLNLEDSNFTRPDRKD